MSKANAFEPRRRARRRALQALYQWQITGHEAGEILAQFRAAQDMSGVDEAHFEQLLRGVIAGQQELDDALGPFLDRPVAQLDLMERAILRIGAWELLNSPETPWRVVLDECIDLAHRFGATDGHSYVNAVLDKLVRHARGVAAAPSRQP
jgi:N utilization substance protein B